MQVVMQHGLSTWGWRVSYTEGWQGKRKQSYTVTRHFTKRNVLILLSSYTHSLSTYIYIYISIYIHTYFFIDGVMQKVTSEKRTLSFNKGNIKSFSPAQVHITEHQYRQHSLVYFWYRRWYLSTQPGKASVTKT